MIKCQEGLVWDIQRKICIQPLPHYLLLIGVGLTGYLLGVLGSFLFGQTTQMHHWVIAVVGMVAVLILSKMNYLDRKWYWLGMIFFIGMFISDIEDVVRMEYWSYDPPGDNHWM